jgi:hypothetical protein
MKRRLLLFIAVIAVVIVLAACSRVRMPDGLQVRSFGGYIGVELVWDGNTLTSINIDWNNDDIVGFVDTFYPMVIPQIIDNINNNRDPAANLTYTGSGATISFNAMMFGIRSLTGEEVEQEDPSLVPCNDRLFENSPYTASVLGWANPGVSGSRPYRGTRYIHVQVHFDGPYISAIDVDFNLESENWVNRINPFLVDEIIRLQSTRGIITSGEGFNIPLATTGATVTADSVLEAVQIVLDRHSWTTPAGWEPPAAPGDEDVDPGVIGGEENGYENGVEPTAPEETTPPGGETTTPTTGVEPTTPPAAVVTTPAATPAPTPAPTQAPGPALAPCPAGINQTEGGECVGCGSC